MKRAPLALALLLSTATALRAQDARDALPVVEVVASGGPEILAAMAERVRSLEARYAVRVRWSEAGALDPREIVAPHAADAALLTRVWLDLSDPRRALLFIANAGHDRFLVRVVPAQDGYGELTRESLATIVESAVEALLAGGQIGVDRSAALRELAAQSGQPPTAEHVPAQAPPSDPRPPAPEPERAEPERAAGTAVEPWSIALCYRGDAVADGPRLRHGAQLALSYAVDVGVAVDLLVLVTAQLAPSVSLGDGGRALEQRGGGTRAAVGVGARAGRFGWHAALGAGADLFRVEPAIDAAELTAAEPFLAAVPIASVFAGGTYRAAPWLDLALGLGLDVDLAGHHYDVEREGARAALITPWRAHPFAFAGVAVPFGGAR